MSHNLKLQFELCIIQRAFRELSTNMSHGTFTVRSNPNIACMYDSTSTMRMFMDDCNRWWVTDPNNYPTQPGAVCQVEWEIHDHDCFFDENGEVVTFFRNRVMWVWNSMANRTIYNSIGVPLAKYDESGQLALVNVDLEESEDEY